MQRFRWNPYPTLGSAKVNVQSRAAAENSMATDCQHNVKADVVSDVATGSQLFSSPAHSSAPVVPVNEGGDKTDTCNAMRELHGDAAVVAQAQVVRNASQTSAKGATTGRSIPKPRGKRQDGLSQSEIRLLAEAKLAENESCATTSLEAANKAMRKANVEFAKLEALIAEATQAVCTATALKSSLELQPDAIVVNGVRGVSRCDSAIVSARGTVQKKEADTMAALDRVGRCIDLVVQETTLATKLSKDPKKQQAATALANQAKALEQRVPQILQNATQRMMQESVAHVAQAASLGHGATVSDKK